MKVTFPHMGNIYIPLKAFFEKLNIQVVVPPKCTKQTLELGVKYSPEFACLPLKITIGNFIEAIENGADTIVMAGGIGPCRFGYYCEVQREILQNLGYKFNMIVLEPPKGNLIDLITNLKHITNKKENGITDIYDAAKLGWEKAILLDDLDKKTATFRPTEINKGDTDKIYNKIVNLIDSATEIDDLKNIKLNMDNMFKYVPHDARRQTVKIGIIGEIYTVLEPFANLNIEKQLGCLGVEVNRNIYITDWVRLNLFPSFLKPKEHKKFLDLAKPYINHFVGGHGQETVAQVAWLSKQGYKGAIHLLPFTCMPEIVAKSVLPGISKKYDIPVMTLVIDEHSAETGLRTRLEAFVDMIKHKTEVENFDKVFARN